jgi:hypothetical protein
MLWRIIKRIIEITDEEKEILKWARDEHMEMIVPQKELWRW